MNKKISNKYLQLKSDEVLSKIIERRKELGISQTMMADYLHITLSGYYKVEKGETKLDLFRLFEIAYFLKIDTKEFF